ncbi:4-coumarate--CoA ligase 2 [Chionoecetes opilio]|uniref:4-coumarate--CoA ligase 2 n=1 Tax=Chionoecetes opilio TaxID=41210 RepID=A0A8J5D593_CHIOP|nr:4-coumarate--CoA ligase 2 [Chionoecetes opilio]
MPRQVGRVSHGLGLLGRHTGPVFDAELPLYPGGPGRHSCGRAFPSLIPLPQRRRVASEGQRRLSGGARQMPREGGGGGDSLLQKPLRRITNTDASPPAGVPSLGSLLQDSSLPLADPVEVIGTETALIPYSSGTTGTPRALTGPHKALTSNVAIFSPPSFYSAKASTETHQDCFLCYLPLFHSYALLPVMMVGPHSGVKIVTMPKFDANAYVPQIIKHKVSRPFIPPRAPGCVGAFQDSECAAPPGPSVFNFLTQSPDVTPESWRLCRVYLRRGARVPVIRGNLYTKVYGMTEVLMSHLNPLNATRPRQLWQLYPTSRSRWWT